MKRVVVTGVGLVTPLGCDVTSFEKNMFNGASGIRSIRGNLVAENFPIPYAGMVDKSALEALRELPLKNRLHNRFWLFAAGASDAALKELPTTYHIDGLIYGTAEGVSYEVIELALKTFTAQNSLGDFDWRETETEGSLETIAELLEARGFPRPPDAALIAINSACASGNQALGLAFERIRSGQWTRCLAGGVDARCNPSSLMNFHLLGAVTTADVPPETASRPFSKSRSGFVRAEGAATLLLEDLESALARKAPIWGEIIGAANTSDAYRLTDGREDGESVIEAMRQSLEDARISPDMIDAISAHGTSTPLNDRLESQAIHHLFGNQAPPVTALKSQIGHPTVAAGAIEAISCLLMLRAQRLAPTLNLTDPDPECDLDCVPLKSRAAPLRHMLSNSFGFGGQNSCLILKKYEAPV